MPHQSHGRRWFYLKGKLAFAKGNRVKDALFAKKRSPSIHDMAKSKWVYKKWALSAAAGYDS